jgi:hypothetical protein
MIGRAALPLLMVLALMTVPLVAQEKTAPANRPGANPAFEQFKRLPGDWVGRKMGEDGHDVQVNYKLTAGGSALVETIFPGSEHEMVTVIHPDGADLLLTHYCMLGNQPHMKASGTNKDGKVEFKFVRATNLKSPNDMYMHDVTFHFVDSDTLRTHWTHFKDGKSAGQVDFELKRKK